MEYQWEIQWHGETKALGKKPVAVQVFLKQISHGLIWDSTLLLRGYRRVEGWNVTRGLQVNSRQCWAASREGEEWVIPALEVHTP